VNGQLKIVDFGFDKPIQETIDLKVIQRGSYSFCSPEMLFTKKQYFSSDIWSVGVIIYYLANQKMPFDSFDAILNSDPAPLPTTFTNEFNSLVSRMMDKNCLTRPNTETFLDVFFENFPETASTFPEIYSTIIFLTENSESQNGIVNY
jgi:serine/threonine protein kinase